MDLFSEIAYFIRDWWVIIAAFFGLIMAGYQGVQKITEALRSIRFQLERINEKFLESERELTKIWSKLEDHDHVIDELVVDMARTQERSKVNEKDLEGLEKRVHNIE